MGDAEAEHHAVLVMLGDVAVHSEAHVNVPALRSCVSVRHNFAAALAFKRLAVGG
jgi:chemotaxis receptor (MCP) glutamine deamidase CheD